MQETAFRNKFAAYIVFLLLSIYLSNYFQGQIHEANGEEKFTDQDYRKLFEYEVEGQGPLGG